MNKVYDVVFTNKFKKNYKKMQQQKNFKNEEFEKVIEMLSNDVMLPEKYNNHLLKPKSKGIWECHIQNDVLLEYKKNDKELVLLLLGLGSHSELFK